MSLEDNLEIYLCAPADFPGLKRLESVFHNTMTTEEVLLIRYGRGPSGLAVTTVVLALVAVSCAQGAGGGRGGSVDVTLQE